MMRDQARLWSGWPIIAGIVFCGFIVVGCEKPRSPVELYGTYVANYEAANEILTLIDDGTYTQQVTIKTTSKKDIAKGRWTYDVNRGYINFDSAFIVVLNGFREFDQDYLKPKPGVVSEPVGKKRGHITIGTDEGILYEKI